MRTLILLCFLFSFDVHAGERVPELVGMWKSSRGALYKSDGTNFVCTTIPEGEEEYFGYWLNKNRLTDFKFEGIRITCTHYLRWKNGRVDTIRASIEVNAKELKITIIDPPKGMPSEFIFTRHFVDSKDAKKEELTSKCR